MSAPAIAFVFARGGSKGVPRKNVRMLDGKPLIAHAIGTALACPSVGRVVVSTDDEEIAAVARDAGAGVPFLRPAALAQDATPEWLAWQHAVRQVFGESPDPSARFVSLPATSPFRSVEDVEGALRLLEEGFDAVLTVTPARRNPYFNMVRLGEDGRVSLATGGGPAVTRRQDAPALYDITTVAYAVRPDYIVRAAGLLEGRVGAVVVPEERAIDIDTEMDFQYAEFLIARREKR